MSSALANQLVFVVWGVVVAAGHAALWAHGQRTGVAAAVSLARLLFWQAFGWSLFAVLLARHLEVLDLAFRAFLPAIYTALVVRPALYLVAAGALLVAALAVFLRHRRRRG